MWPKPNCSVTINPVQSRDIFQSRYFADTFESKSIMQLPTRKKKMIGLVGLLALVSIGCEANRPKEATSQKARSNAVVQPATPELDAAGAKLSRDSQDAVIAADLRGCTLGDPVIAELSQLTSLQQLDMRECVLSNDQLKSIVKPLVALRALRLSGKGGATSVDDDGMVAIEDCTELIVLALDELWISEVGLKALLGCKQLSELYLAGTTVVDESMTTVAEFKQLKKLRLARTQISAAGLQELVGLKLEDLDLSECSQVTDAALEVVAQFTTLKRLNLWRDAVSDEGVSKLAGLHQLTWYNLDNTQLTDAGLDHLSGMQELTFLHLGSTGVSDAGMPKLSGLKKLKDLKVTRTSVTEAGAKLLTDQLPGLEVQVKYREEQ